MGTTRRAFIAGTAAGFVGLRATAAGKPQFFSIYDAQARKLLTQLSLEEKVGQMTQPDQMFLKSIDDIEKFHLGSLLSGGDSDPKSGNDLQSWTDMYDRYQTRALKAKPRIPLLYGVDAVHGHNNVIGATVFPQNVGLGCTRDAKLIERAARVTAEEVKATGINWAFAPCVTVPQDIRWGRTYEGFSESPDVVKVLGEAAVRGMQGKSLNDPLAVLACAKHYAGDGGTTYGTGMPKGPNTKDRYPLDRGDTRMDEASLRKLHLQGYITTVNAGVGTIMPSYSSWNGEKCSGNKRLLTEILKNEFGFEGFLISDYNAINEMPGSYKDQIAQSVNAGMDMMMVPQTYEQYFNYLVELTKENKVPMARIDDAVLRILKVKFAMGMMDEKRSQLADRNLHKNFGSADHRAVARECVKKSIVVLKNDKRALPVQKNTHVHVAGKSADDIGNQCGGWTITWQGKSGAITKGTTILQGLRDVAPGMQVTYSRDGNGAQGAKIGIAVIGEMPYAEFEGDRTDLHLAAEDVAAVENLKKAGIPVIAVIVSGRPLVIDAIVDKADAIVAAWLPGTEGGGVADVLLGDYKPTGKLSFTWPRGDSTSMHRGDSGYKTLYAFGHGLSY